MAIMALRLWPEEKIMPPDTQKKTPPPRSAPRWGRIFLILVLSLLLILAGGITWLLNDTERLKSGVEKLVSSLTQRPFYIHGDFDFHLGREISISATQIEWANAAWSSQPTMLTIESADVSVVLSSLLNPPIIISKAIATDARLDFEWSPDNKSNWLLIESDKPDKDQGQPKNPLPLLLDTADLSNVELHIRHPGLTEELVIQVEHAKQKQDDENRLVLDIDTLFDNRKFEIDGRIGPFPELIIAGAVDFRLRAAGPEASTDLEGSFSNLAALTDPNLQFVLTAPEITNVLDAFNLPAITSGELNLKGSIESGESNVNGSIKGVIGEFDIDATLSTDNLRTLQGLSANIVSQGPNTATAGNAFGISGLPAEPYELKVSLADTPAGLKIDQAYFTTAGAKATASGVIQDFPNFDRINLQLNVDIPDITQFQGLLPGKNIPRVPVLGGVGKAVK
jgi:hypothetical protein